MFKRDCNKHGHKFEARYTEEIANSEIRAESIRASDLRKILLHQKYVHDICTKCGKIIKPTN